MSFRSSEKEYLAQHPIGTKYKYIIPVRPEDIPELNKLDSDNKMLLLYSFNSFYKGDVIARVFGLFVNDKVTYYRLRIIPEFLEENVYLNISLDTLTRVVETSGAYIRDTNVWTERILLSNLFPTIEDYKKAFYIRPNYVKIDVISSVGRMYLNLDTLSVYIDIIDSKGYTPKLYDKFNLKLMPEHVFIKGKYKNSNDKYEIVKLDVPVYKVA